MKLWSGIKNICQPKAPCDNDCAVVAEGLTKKFGKFVAVDHVSFKVKRGEVFGFLGPNGAGKSTTIRMLVRTYFPRQKEQRMLVDLILQLNPMM